MLADFNLTELYHMDALMGYDPDTGLIFGNKTR